MNANSLEERALSLVYIQGEGFLDTRRMIALGIHIERSFVLLPEWTMLTPNQVEGHI